MTVEGMVSRFLGIQPHIPPQRGLSTIRNRSEKDLHGGRQERRMAVAAEMVLDAGSGRSLRRQAVEERESDSNRSGGLYV